MGTSGIFSTSNTHVKYNISITQNWQSVEGNYSNVTVSVRFWRDNVGYTTYGSGTCYCRINGTAYSATVSSGQKITNAGIVLFSRTLDIYHNADGSKYLEASAWISMNTPLSSGEQGFGEWLSTIPRASGISGISGNTFGSSITVSISRASGSFYHTVVYERPDGNQVTVGTSIGTSCTFTPSISDSNYVTNSAAGTAKIIVHTYSGGTYIGTSSSAFTIYVPSSVVPTVSSVSLSEAVSGIASQFNGYVQGKSKISGSISASGAYGSTIKAYSVAINGANYTGSSFTTDFLTASGNNSCTVTVTDTRNRTATKTVSFSVIPYFAPAINSFTVSRCDSDGTANDEGDCARCFVSADISSTNSKNTKSFKILYKKLMATSWDTLTLSSSQYSLNEIEIIENIDTESEYNFKAVATDYFSSAEYSHNLSTAYTLMDFNKTGKGMAIGKVSTKNAFEVNMDTQFTGAVTINGKSILDIIYPIGSIYMSVNSTNPGTILGGTWVAWGSGRVPIVVDPYRPEFNSAEKVGGDWYHLHTLNSGAAMIGSDQGLADTVAFSHSQNGSLTGTTYTVRGTGTAAQSVRSHNTALTGTTDYASNLPPYITCYMWKRTA